MKRILFILPIATAALLVTSTGVFAEDEKPKGEGRGPGGHNPAERLKMMTEKLGLSEDQTAKIKAIFEKNFPKMKELREDTSLSQEDKRAKFMELRKAEMEEIRAVLTPEQQEKLKELRPGGPGRKGGGKPGEPK